MLSPEATIRAFDVPTFHVVIDRAFGLDVSAQILDEVTSLESSFQPAAFGAPTLHRPDLRSNLVCFTDKVYAAPEERRRSRLLTAFDDLMKSGHVTRLLQSAPFPMSRFGDLNTWSAQVSSYRSGAFYSWHKDRAASDDRVVSMVYYVHSSNIVGGELELGSGVLTGPGVAAIARSTLIPPLHDRLVIFHSRALHRVRPVENTGASDEFRNSRFSINVWVGRKGQAGPVDEW